MKVELETKEFIKECEKLSMAIIDTINESMESDAWKEISLNDKAKISLESAIGAVACIMTNVATNLKDYYQIKESIELSWEMKSKYILEMLTENKESQQ